MMRLFVLLVLFCATIVGAVGQSHANIDDLNWLEGKWNRTNVRDGRTAFEQWKRLSPEVFTGIGAILSEDDTINIEKLQIMARNDTLYYVAEVPENQRPVYFTFTEISPTSFTCENQQHDFPKVIRYVLRDEILTATISGGDKQVDFVFKKE
jgi:hypothetical protein